MGAGHTISLERARDHAFMEKCELSTERRSELGFYEEMLRDLEEQSTYSIQAETVNILGSILGFAAAIIGDTSAGKTVESLGHLAAAGGKFLNTATDGQKQMLQGKIQLLQEKIQDTRASRQEVMSLLHELDRAIREINSAAHDAQKQIMRPH
ncbi:hypothetical protein K0U07_04895 [bacterium]|nr:hypothetical protein [bacterium]